MEEMLEDAYKRALRAAALRYNELIKAELSSGEKIRDTYAAMAAREFGFAYKGRVAQFELDAVRSIGELIQLGTSDEVVEWAIDAAWKIHESHH